MVWFLFKFNCLSSSRIDSRIGSRLVLELYLYYHSRMISGMASVAMCRLSFCSFWRSLVSMHLFFLISSQIILLQTVFSRVKQILNPSSTGAVLCGHNQMTEVCSLSDWESEYFILLTFTWVIYNILGFLSPLVLEPHGSIYLAVMWG